ncbi:MAG: phosphoribosylformylglycinamidine synthase subunit PurL [Bacteroidetes Order II. Incertae sedis bacterium]|nr:phosphoribosylformylglycinamidine synthase subunit PurL [Bacteroidetes Order II. bacterium]MBT4052193.1 phosphoribosylformylglycinamidine synthase subunit PurL [Bacteroidetes Order II. bacterium]MBT4602317.1 phosphoribosylformylglycinamidine synthase subunit PurL [Bacteroidetes Order II. bacterium]MBT5249881.1 phosphoribosylformylglycinamidine synthase subunit PurL [Bacteroidetes Order II. bacterium]MBT6425997.1 phosphoribosylformylglycinamidine synthase subunit PurL [Bacteroidetes Order II.
MSTTLLNEPEITIELAREHGLTDEEYGWILDKLGRTPTFVELGIYSVMWSEHCSYKNSIVELKKLPRDGDVMLVGAGEENAGLVDIGDGMAVAFKIESHNHPSAVEPYQGAATGVGGIQRDIFTMGARPICSLNSLRFGSLENPRVRYLFDGVVRGIGDYGNSFGVPTVGGEVYFDPSYEGNPLVNAMSVGIMEADQMASAIAIGVGNPVYIVGSATGRDGIHGATFASEEISEASEAKRPSVQVGDPFTEKLLLEASLEVINSGVVVGIQDMGAAGITCSSCEMSEKGESGMILHIDKVPIREEGMTPYEIMLSESQERMLIVCQKGKEAELEAIFDKWDLHAVEIGHVTDDGQVKVLWHGEMVADVPAEHLALGGGAPVYIRETKRPAYLDETRAFDPSSITDVNADTASDVLLKILGSPNIASKRWVFEQYDTMVRTNTVVGPGSSDAAVVRLKDSEKGLAVKTDCNSKYVYLNPRKGAQIAVAEAARNVVCAGGKPVAITNCLNFGNPYKPEQYWVFKEAVSGMGEACRAFNTPVTGGNVSFYNENPEGAVYPTPTIGMLGVVEDVKQHATAFEFKQEGDLVLELSPEAQPQLGIEASEYLTRIHGVTAGDAPSFTMEGEIAVQEACLSLIRLGLVQSAHDVSDGGMAVSLAEMCLASDGLGADINLDASNDQRLDSALFSEAQSRIILAVRPEKFEKIRQSLDGFSVQLKKLGVVVGDGLTIAVAGEPVISASSAGMHKVYENAIPDLMSKSL